MPKIAAKKSEMKGGYLIKYHVNGAIWSKGKVKDNQPDGYWEWYRNDGKLKRSGYWQKGQPIGEWTTYKNGKPYKVTKKKAKK
jgi:antitoxin component YwqK of YwqJK toxin-antitoxin module